MLLARQYLHGGIVGVGGARVGFFDAENGGIGAQRAFQKIELGAEFDVAVFFRIEVYAAGEQR
jgi:hypothetical protein